MPLPPELASKSPEEILGEIKSKAQERLSSAATLSDLEGIRIEFLGKKSQLLLILRSLGELPEARRPRIGSLANRVKREIEEALEEKTKALKQSSRSRLDWDLTLPAICPRTGSLHPVTQIIREIVTIFRALNYEIASGREVETEFYNFTALNIPPDHPSRDSFDTFFTHGGNLLRSQTSTVQIRLMQVKRPPLRMVAPGRVYRPDVVDASHSFMFHQIEGLAVDRSITFSDLKGTLHYFLRELFGKETQIRFRPHFFPFTEPSVEVDVQCFLCGGKGCSVCSQKGWLEVMGAGMVDPFVFEQVDYDPKVCQGFAFGLGVERLAMLRFGIRDIRLFFENDLAFLEQF